MNPALKKYFRITLIGLFIFSAWLVYSFMREYVTTDFIGQANSVIQINLGLRTQPGSFLFFWMMQLLTFNSDNYTLQLYAMSIVMGLALAAKFFFSFRPAVQYFKTEVPSSEASNYALPVFLLLCTVLFFVQPVPELKSVAGGSGWLSKFFILGGKFSPNNWHNATIILIMPFALLLFWKSFRYFENPQINTLFEILFLCILNILIKPSFFFVFCVVFPLFALIRFGFAKTFFQVVLTIFIAGLSLLLEYYSTYVNEGTASTDSGIVIAPFHVWRLYSTNIFRDFFLSLLFPLVVLAIHYKEIIRDNFMRYAWAIFGTGFLIFILFSEKGRLELHGNFAWQNIVCSYLLFYCTGVFWLKKLFSKRSFEWKDGVISFVLILHLASGVLFFFKAFAFHMAYHI